MSFIFKVRDSIERDVFSLDDLKLIMPSMSDAAIHSGITRSLKAEDITKLKRGLYLFSKKLQKDMVSHFLIANKIYDPSYISFESALSFHGMIPEAVYTTTSACHQRKNKTFSNTLGEFTYNHIPVSPFFMGVENIKEQRGALIANPLRALLDLIYIERSSYSSVENLEKDLRIEKEFLKEEMEKFTFLEVEELAKSYKRKNILEFVQMLMRTFK